MCSSRSRRASEPVRSTWAAGGLSLVLLSGAIAAPGTIASTSAGSASPPIATLDRAGQRVEVALDAGERVSLPLQIDRDVFAAGVISPSEGVVTATLYGPDGVRLRRFADDSSRAIDFGFVAEASGLHRLELARSDAARTRVVVMLDQLEPTRRKAAAAPSLLESPRLDRLRRDAARRPAAVADFWTEIARTGAPLVEPLDDRRSLVTFLWRHRPDTRSVRMFWPVFPERAGDDELERIAGTDVWFRTIHAPRGARVSYQLAPNVPSVGAQRRARRRALLAVAQADPLNPRRWPEDASLDRFAASSVLELPGAPEQVWAGKRPGASAEQVSHHRVPSRTLGNERDVSVYVPPGLTPPRDAALLILFDRGPFLHRVAAHDVVANLIAAGRIPATVVVFVGHPTSESRGVELPPNSAFAQFLATELVPWVRERYPVTRDPARTVVGGASYGGIAATYAALQHPAVFGNVLSQSGSYWWAPAIDPARGAAFDEFGEPNWLAREVAGRPRLDIRFYLEAGLFEANSEILPMTRHFRDVLVAKGYDVVYRDVAGGHDPLSWRGGLAEGVIALLGTGRRPA